MAVVLNPFRSSLVLFVLYLRSQTCVSRKSARCCIIHHSGEPDKGSSPHDIQKHFIEKICFIHWDTALLVLVFPL